MGVPLDLTTDPRTLKTSPPFPSLTFGGFATNRFVQRLIWKGGESLPSDMSLRVPAVTLVFGFSRRKPPSVEPDGKTSGKLGRPLTRLSPRHFFLFSGRRNVAQRRKERNVGESSAVQLPGLRLTRLRFPFVRMVIMVEGAAQRFPSDISSPRSVVTTYQIFPHGGDQQIL